MRVNWNWPRAAPDVTILAIIPARGGSKSIPDKNLAPLGGKPLIAWSIEQSLASRQVDRTIVSTDSPKIAEAAKEFGADVPFMRPAELAGDTATTESAMVHAVETLAQDGYEADDILLLQPTCPIRKPGAIDAAIDLRRKHDADSVVSAQEIHPFLWNRPGDARAHYDFRNRPRRQDVADEDRLFEENGSIYLTRCTLLRGENCRVGGKIVIYEMSALESVDIDTPDDLALAEAAMTLMRAH